jgi:F-type H+-transporting ATPase subunit b
MPQINQLADVAWSQLFWLLLVLGAIYFGIGKAMLPKIQSTVEQRNRRIADDLAAAQAARAAADETEAAYRSRMDASRAEALKLAGEAKQAAARAGEERIRAAAAETEARVTEAEARIRAATAAASGEIERAAADAVRDLAERLAGIRVTEEEAAAAVKAELADG